MTQEEKLRNTLREFYDNQQFRLSDNEWELAAARLNAARRKSRIIFSVIIVTALVAVLMIVFRSPRTADAKKLLSVQKSDSLPASRGIILKTQGPTAKVQFETQDDNVSTAKPVRLPAIAEPAGSVAEKAAEITKPKAAVAAQNFDGQKSSVAEMSADKNVAVVLPAREETVSAAHDTRSDDVKPAATSEFSENPKILPLEKDGSELPDQKNPVNGQTWLLSNRPVDSPTQIAEPAAGITPVEIAKLSTPESTVEGTPTDSARRVLTAISPTEDEPLAVDTLHEVKAVRFWAGEGIYYEAGAAWLYGWKGPAHRDARGLSPVVGIHYMNRLNKRCAASFGIQYLQVSNLSNSSKTSRVSSYVYGEQSTVTVITPSTAYYLLAPLRFHYYVGRRNSFGAGINLSYLLNVDANVTSYDEKPGITDNYKTVKLGGYTEGFSWFDSQLAIFYAGKITKSFGLQIEFFAGLVDVKQDEFFDFKNKEKNSGIKLSLIYYAFRKTGK